MHMKADPWCCRFALHGCDSKQRSICGLMNPAMIGDSTKKKSTTNPSAPKKKPLLNKPLKMRVISSIPPLSDIPALIGDDSSLISALTDIEYDKVVPPIPGFHCPNPNCPKSKSKRYTGRGYDMHLKASTSCNDYFLVALWHDYNLVMNETKTKEEENSSIMTTTHPVRDDTTSDLTNVHYDHASNNIPDISCPNPNCPQSKATKRYNHGEFPLLHLQGSTLCVNFILQVVHSRLPPEMSGNGQDP